MTNEIKILDGEIQTTTDLNQFKKLKGNRNTAEARISKIERSVKKVGWIMPAIIVNENMEVIDGQGRLEVAKRNGLPISYKVIEGIGIEECITMNIDQTNWSIEDFCRSYEEQGSEDYARFNRILDAFNFPFSVVVTAITGQTTTASSQIKEGRLKCSKEQAELADKALSWLEQFRHCAGESTTTTATEGGSSLYKALLFVFTSVDGCDLNRVVDQVSNYEFSSGETLPTVRLALKFIERRYNARLSAHKKVYFEHEYTKMLAEKLPWYEAKWGWKVYE